MDAKQILVEALRLSDQERAALAGEPGVTSSVAEDDPEVESAAHRPLPGTADGLTLAGS